jgi:cytosine permease
VSAESNPDVVHEEIGHDDYSLSRVPESDRYSWLTVAIQRFGQLSALSQFLLGATLGFGMSFWSAFLALTLGAVILEIVAILTGIAGQREGLSTSVLARWTGFGRYGSSLIGLVVAVSLIGWFGVQNAVFAEGVYSLVGGLPTWVWSIIMGELVFSPAPGPQLSLAAGTTLVAGGFIVGAVITPDMTRFNRSVADVIKQTVVGITLGEYTIGLIGVLLAHAVKSVDVIEIVTSTSGVIGTLILVTATLKINDWNLYSSSLGLANFIDTIFGRRFNRALITIVVGVLGTVLSAAGILEQFVGFLTVLGVVVPPIAGIMVVDYYLLRRHRSRLEDSARSSALPTRQEQFNPVTLVVWAIASVVGYVSQERWGIPALNSLLCAALLYYLVMKALALVQNRPQVEFSETVT